MCDDIGMAKKTILIDDIDGSEGASSYTFALNGKTYIIDLSDKNYAELETVLAKYIEASRVDRSNRPATGVASTSDARAIRAWAEATGLLPKGSRGRVPATVRAAYQNRG